MLQGTTSDARKTTLVAALCHLLTQQGVKVVPFKPQNMALNRAVTSDDGEFGPAQPLQAIAAGLPLRTDLNSAIHVLFDVSTTSLLRTAIAGLTLQCSMIFLLLNQQ